MTLGGVPLVRLAVTDGDRGRPAVLVFDEGFARALRDAATQSVSPEVGAAIRAVRDAAFVEDGNVYSMGLSFAIGDAAKLAAFDAACAKLRDEIDALVAIVTARVSPEVGERRKPTGG